MIRWLRRIVPRWVAPELEVRDEVASHLEMRTDDLIRQGLPHGAARAQAEREFGDVAGAIDELSLIDQPAHRVRRLAALTHDLLGDIRLGWRLLLRAPAFTMAALATLAIALGGNTAAFSLFHEVLLRRLPYPQPDRLVTLWETIAATDHRTEASWPDFLDLRSQARSFAHLEGYNPTNVSVTRTDGARMFEGVRVTSGFFDLLGQGPALGHGFRPEDEAPGGPQVVVVSHRFWQDVLGGSPGVLDSVIILDARPVRVLGVLPPEFRLSVIGDAALWLPFDPDDDSRQQRFNHQVRVLGRMDAGVSFHEAAAEVATVMSRLAADHPETNQGRSAELVPLADEVTGPARPVLVALLAAMLLVLAVAGANIAGLLSARAAFREEEMVVRAALGATRGRLIRQLLVESLVLALTGGLLGLAVAALLIRALSTALPEAVRVQFAAPPVAGLQGAAVGYSFLLTLLVGVGFGLAPMLHVLRGARRLMTGGRRVIGGPGPRLLRGGLIVVEVALTMALLSGAVLVGRSLATLLGLDLGFRPEGVTTVRVALYGPRYAESPTAQQRFFEDLMRQVRTIPGVRAVGAVDRLPLEGSGTLTLRVEGQPERPASEREEVVARGVGGEYFQTLRVPLIEGRYLAPSDDRGRPPVVLVDQTTAQRFFGAADPVGARLRFYAFPEQAWEVVGVVGAVQTGRADGPTRPAIYFSHLQAAENRMSLVVRAGIDPEGLIREIRHLAVRLDPAAAVYAERTLVAQVRESTPLLFRRLSLLLLALCAGLALVLAMVGVYGLVALTVAERRRELGIRAALGAGPRTLMRLVIRRCLLLCGVGTIVGLLLSLLLANGARSLLFGVSPADPATYLATGVLLAGVAVVASWLPARRAARTNPAEVLQQL